MKNSNLTRSARSARLLLGLLALLGSAEAGRAWTVTLTGENDLPANSDRYYTNGFSAAFVQQVEDEDVILPWALRVPGLSGEGALAQGFELGQIIVTPAEIARPVPDPTDRPYAGVLYAGVSWQRSGRNDFSAFKLMAGVMGPASLAGQTQKEVHRLFGATRPEGWDYQVRNEPVINFLYERRWRTMCWGSQDRWGGDVIAIGGVMAGTLLTQAHVQAQVRYGWKTPRDFGTSLIRGAGAMPVARDKVRAGFHLYLGAGGFAVAHSATIDGSLFRSGPGVKSRAWVQSFEVGTVARGTNWQVTTAWVIWGREFETQVRHSEFASVTLTYFR